MTTEQATFSRPLWARYAVAIVSVAAATGLRLLGEPYLDGRVPFGLFFLSVMVTAWYGGQWPALSAVALGVLSAAHFIIEPGDSLWMTHPADFMAMCVYAAVSVICILLIESVRNQRKRAQQSAVLNSYLNDELNESSRRKDEFLAMLAHELRNPLMPLQNGLDVLERPDAPAAMLDQAADMMRRQLSQLVRLVDDLLNVSRFLRGAIELNTERLDLAEVVQMAVESVQPDIDHAQHELVVTLPERPVFVEGDRVRLAQVISNLLHNATKYTDRQGCIRLKVQPERTTALISIRDNGMGIAPAMMENIFTLFTQADDTRGRAQGGLGIGLALVRHLVKLHGGGIDVHSDGLGRGSIFRVRLPLAEDLSATSEADPEESIFPGDAAPPDEHPRRRVLVVDDNVDAVEMLTMLLQFDGHEVLTAHEGRTAIQLVRSHNPDVVLLDIGLPRMDGYEVARVLRRELRYRGLIAAVTGWGSRDDCARSRDAGFDAHLVKPVSLEVIQALLKDPRKLPRPRRKLEDSAEITTLRLS